MHEKGRGELFYILLVHVCNRIAAQYSVFVEFTSRLLNDFESVTKTVPLMYKYIFVSSRVCVIPNQGLRGTGGPSSQNTGG